MLPVSSVMFAERLVDNLAGARDRLLAQGHQREGAAARTWRPPPFAGTSVGFTLGRQRFDP